MPVKFANVLKSTLIFNIFYCFLMFVNKLFTHLTCAYLKKRCFNVKSSTYHFHITTKLMADFQICIALSEISQNSESRVSFLTKLQALVFSCEFCEIYKNTFFHRTPLGDCFCLFIIISQLSAKHL